MPLTESRGLWKTTREVSGGQKCGQKMRSSFKKKKKPSWLIVQGDREPVRDLGER